MASKSRPSKSNKSSIKYWWLPLEVQSFEPDAFLSKDGVSSSRAKSHTQSEAKSPSNGVSTAQFVSAVAGLWDCIGQPTTSLSKENLKFHDLCQQENIICHSNREKKHKSTSLDNENFSNDRNSKIHLSSAASNFEDLKKVKETLLFASCNRTISSIWKHTQVNGFHSHVNAGGTSQLVSVGISGDLANPNESITKKSSQLSNQEVVSGDEYKETDESSNAERKNLLADASQEEGTNVTAGCEVASGGIIVENVLQAPSSLYSTYSLKPMQITKEAIIVFRNPSSVLQLDYNVEVLNSTDSILGQYQQAEDSHNKYVESLAEVSTSKDKSRNLFNELVFDEECPRNYWISIQDKLQITFARNRHAIAGAMAGTLVSLCLHPVDTVKTIIQANGMGQKSFYHILKRTISEKGILGLYRGIASNIASSAPISAIYTFTYESVKGALLPLVPKEHHSFAHCIAGGCSSIATSFIFTPSERIKQQMQAGSRYQNCWNALIGCLEKGGVPSLYAGWGAVLCRNIPHSIIKFYTYESLKQLLLSSEKPDPTLNTLQTLVCGGLAGSTAALFSTPFDVVKTRLQTQAPGTLGKYNGVFHALQEIARQEGLQGLYRGLAPRLAMYVSQGAIFFASYEFLKAVLALDVPKTSQVIENEEKVDDPVPPRTQKLHS